MDNFKVLILSSLITVSSAFSRTASVEDQLLVTRDSVSNLVNDLHSRSSVQGVSSRDYDGWGVQFRREIEDGLLKYEKTLSDNIFPVVQQQVGYYLHVFHNESMPQSQKIEILNSIKVQLKASISSLTPEYHKALRSLYNAHEALPVNFKMKSQKKPFSSKRILNFTLVYSNGKVSKVTKNSEVESHNSDHDGFSYRLYRDDYIYFRDVTKVKELEVADIVPQGSSQNEVSRFIYSLFSYSELLDQVIRGCESKMCLVLKTSDLSFFYSSVKNAFDKNIEIALPSVSGQPEVLKIPALNKDISVELDILKRTDYPAMIESLPFVLK